MRPLLLSLILAGAVSASLLHAESSPPAPSSSANSSTSSTAAPEKAPAPANDAPAAATSSPAAQPSSSPTAPAAQAPTNAAGTAPAPTTATTTTAAAPARAEPQAAQAAAPASTAADGSAVAELTKRLTAMEQLLLEQRNRETIAQRDREATMYRDTNRLITIFGVSFAAIGVVALIVAAYLNFRGLATLQSVSAPRPILDAPEPASRGLLPAGGPVPGMERVQASGQRFQSRMSSLEHRLAELEHIAGRETGSDSADETGSTDGIAVSDRAATAPVTPLPVPEVEPVEQPRRVIPRAALMVHKAQALMNLGKLDEALATLDEAAAIDRTRGDVHLARGQVLEKLGRLGDALLAYEAAVESDATNTGALLMKAGVLNRQERFSEALACYERALEVARTTG